MRHTDTPPLLRPSATPSPLRRGGRAVRFALLLVLASVLLAGAALANGAYDIPWFTVDGGGGESAGGGFTLGGTVGQPDAGAMLGGEYALLGGFWPGAEALNYRYLPIILRP